MNLEIIETQNLPDDPELKPIASQWAKKASDFYKNKDYENAELYLKKALYLDPLAEAYYLQMAKAVWNLDREAESLEYLNKAIELNPYFSDGFFERASTLQAENRFGEAIADYNRSNDLNYYSKIHIYIAECKYEIGNIEDAITELEKYLKIIGEQNTEVLQRIAKYRNKLSQSGPPVLQDAAYFEQNEFAKASETYTLQIEDYREKRMNSDELYLERGRCYISLDEPRAAINDYTTVINNSEDEELKADAYWYRGLAKRNALKRIPEALEDLLEAEKIYSESKPLQYVIGRCFYDLDDYENAATKFEKSVADADELSSQDEDAMYRWGYALRKLNRLQESYDVFEKLLNHTDHIDALYQFGVVSSALDNEPAAIKALTKYISYVKDEPSPYLSRAEAYYYSGDHKNALDDYQTYLDMGATDHKEQVLKKMETCRQNINQQNPH